MISNEYDAEQLYHTAEVILDVTPEMIIERGLAYYQKDRVAEMKFHDRVYMETTVQGTRSYRIIIDLNFFFNSTCSCPYEGVCKHMVAAVCQAISPFDDPVPIFKGTKVARHSTPVPAVTEEAILETDSAENWIEAFEKAFPRFVTDHSYELSADYLRFYHQFAKKANSWSQGLRVLYQMHLLLFCLQQLEGKSTFYPSYHQKMEASRALMDQMPFLSEETEGLHLVSAYPKEWREWSFLFSARVFSAEPSPVDWLSMYRNVHWHLLNDPALVQEEISRLRAVWDKPALNLSQKRQLRLAVAHLEVMSGKDEAAREILEPIIESHNIRDAFYYLPAFAETGQWERVHGWLRWLYPYLQHADRQDLQYVFRYGSLWAEQQPSDEEWLDMLASLLPRSFHFYSQQLLDTGRFKLWIDLHLKEKYTPFHIPKDILKIIEAQDLPSLLPLYHRAVEESIGEKSRPGYKNAVKLLKKLRTYYKRLKQPQRWELFIQKLSERHKRLRAFQEELRKGKLIHD